MDPFAIEFENLVNSITDVEKLMSFATFWDIHVLAVVRRRLFLLRNPENEQLDNVIDYSKGRNLAKTSTQMLQFLTLNMYRFFYWLI